MRLSDAIATGRILVCPKAGGSTARGARPGDGCVLDMAVRAAGGTGLWVDAKDIWPWLEQRYDGRTYEWAIIDEFDYGIMGLAPSLAKFTNLDQLIDFIRQVEPPDPPAPAGEVAEAVRCAEVEVSR